MTRAGRPSRDSFFPVSTPAEALRRARRSWTPTVAGWACLLIGLLDAAAGLRRGLIGRVGPLANILPGVVTSAATAFTVVIGLLLVLLALALRRRKRRAYRVVVVLLALSVAGHLLRGHSWRAVLVSLLLLVWLLINRREFYALGDPLTRLRAVMVAVGLVAMDLAIGLLSVSARPQILLGSPSLADKLGHVLAGLVGVGGPLRFASERYADFVSALLLGLGMITLLFTAYLALRPEEPAARLGPHDETRMRELLARSGQHDSLGYFALRRDKSVLWSESGKAAVTYRVELGVMLASGDPLGDPEAWPGAIRRFLAEADRHAWVPAVMGCSETGGQVWTREGGLQALELGDEAVVQVADFSLSGRAMRNVRQMVARVARAGYVTQVRRVGELSVAERARIGAQAASWRAGESERGFSMALGRLGDPADDDCVLVTAHHQDRLVAFLHFVPWGNDGLSLDLMRRDRGADPGLNELLIVSALQAAGSLGVTRVSLNFALFRSTFERADRLGAGPVVRAMRNLLRLLSRRFQIESLYRFNAKFAPQWMPRYLLYPKASDLPRIALAALEAEAFVRLPRLFQAEVEADAAAHRARSAG